MWLQHGDSSPMVLTILPHNPYSSTRWHASFIGSTWQDDWMWPSMGLMGHFTAGKWEQDACPTSCLAGRTHTAWYLFHMSSFCWMPPALSRGFSETCWETCWEWCCHCTISSSCSTVGLSGVVLSEGAAAITPPISLWPLCSFLPAILDLPGTIPMPLSLPIALSASLSSLVWLLYSSSLSEEALPHDPRHKPCSPNLLYVLIIFLFFSSL